jgi:hypothetical protein
VLGATFGNIRVNRQSRFKELTFQRLMFTSPNTWNRLVDVDQQRVRLVEDKEFAAKYHATKCLPQALKETSSALGNDRLLSRE